MTISKAIRETREKLLEVVNNSGMPIDVLDLMVGELHTAIHQQAEQIYEQELQQEQAEESEEASAEQAE